MGLILDSSALIKAERQGLTVPSMLLDFADRYDEALGISVITVAELAHGAARALSAEQRSAHDSFLSQLLETVDIYPVTTAVALRAGYLDGENTARGLRIPLPDILIGCTALELGFSLLTANYRHFERIPGLKILPT